MRIYDPRVGRFLSVDPISRKYPELTPYQFASNRPIDGIDLDGLEFKKSDVFFISPIGKYGYQYSITVSLANEKNQLHLTNPSDKVILDEIKKSTEMVYSNYQAAGTNDDPIVMTSLTFTEEKGSYEAIFKDFTSYANYKPTTGKYEYTGDPSAYGVTKPGSNSLTAEMTLALSNKMTLRQKDKPDIAFKPEGNSVEVIAKSFGHEIGHTVGLKHPWSKENDIHEIDNTLALPPTPGSNVDLIKNNLMNSEGNPIPSLRSKTGTELIKQQRDKINSQISKDQPPIK